MVGLTATPFASLTTERRRRAIEVLYDIDTVTEHGDEQYTLTRGTSALREDAIDQDTFPFTHTLFDEREAAVQMYK